AADIDPLPQTRGERLAVPALRHFLSQQLEQSCGDIDLVVQGTAPPGSEPRPAQDQRDVCRILVRSLVIAVDVELAEGLAVIGGHHDGRVALYAQLAEELEQFPYAPVGGEYADIVAIEHPAHRRHVDHLLRLPWVVGAVVFVGAEAPAFLCAVRPTAGPMSGPHLLRQPGG